MRLTVGICVVLVIAAAVALSVLAPDRPRAAEEPAAAAPEPPPLPVRVVEVQPRPLAERLSTTGTLRANEQVELVSEIAGKVRAIQFKEGAIVERGQVLVRIDDAELQARRDSVRHRLKLAETRETRQRELREQGIVSEAEYDIASNELNVLRAELALVEAQLEKTEIRAPFGGVVGLRYVSEGSLLSPQTRIATLADLDPIKLDFTLPEQYVGRLRAGDAVEFNVKGAQGTFRAEVYAVEPRIDPATRSLTIRAVSPNPRHELIPGAFADVQVTVAELRDALVVPALAVVPELGGRKVFVFDDGMAQPRSVETGIRTESEVQIVSGLRAGDRVIVSAIQQLRAGLSVEPIADAETNGASR